ncbi:MAG: hypothetical protein Q9227_001144 [Pyrenula ochraceoflavens]
MFEMESLKSSANDRSYVGGLQSELNTQRESSGLTRQDSGRNEIDDCVVRQQKSEIEGDIILPENIRSYPNGSSWLPDVLRGSSPPAASEVLGDNVISSLLDQRTDETLDDIDLPQNSNPFSVDLIRHPGKPRKRPHFDEDEALGSVGTSSDPAIFSSDDIPSGVENYAGSKRRKLQWKGPWWREARNGQKRKRSFKRNVDSGVFLGSEETDESLDEEFLEALNEDEQKFSSRAKFLHDQPKALEAGNAGLDASKASRPVVPPSKEVNVGASNWPRSIHVNYLSFLVEPEGMTQLSGKERTHVEVPIDDKSEVIDLSCILSLTEDVRVLNNITITPPIPPEPPIHESSYAPLIPKIKLILANNKLSTLPVELYDVENLSALSVRGNELKRISPLVGNLANLEELNLSQNRLTYLPYELLTLAQKGLLQRLSVFPNPFLPIPADAQRWDLSKDKASGFTVKLAESIPTFYQSNGSVYYPRENEEAYRNILVNKSRSNLLQAPMGVPSLFELSLRTYARLYGPSNLPGAFEETNMRHKAEVAEPYVRGRRLCSVCGRERVLMQVEWIEWHQLSTRKMNVPTQSEGEEVENQPQLLNSTGSRSVSGTTMDDLPFFRAACSIECYTRNRG